MRNSSGMTAERKLGALKRVFSFMTAHAEEVVEPVADNTTTAPQVNFEQLIANARQEEKNKLYPRIQKLEEANKGLVDKSNEQLMQIGTLTAEKKDLETKLGQLQESAVSKEEFDQLQKQNDKLNAEINKLKEAPTVEDIENKIRAEYEVKSYIAEVKAANQNTLVSAFADTISGSTREEVDASLAVAIEKSNQVRTELGITGNQTPAPVPNQTPQVANPTSNSGGTPAVLDIQAIQNMDVRSPEYAEFRKRMGLR